MVRWLVHEAGARLEDKLEDGATALHCALTNGRLDAAAALIAAGADLRAKAKDNSTPRVDACTFEPWAGGSTAQFLARVDATVAYERRRWLLHARKWLYGKERRAAQSGQRLCYGCARARPLDGLGAALCPRGCGGPKRLVELEGEVWETNDGVHDMWFCSRDCYAAAAARHGPACAQGLRWAAAVAAPKPGDRVRLAGLVAKPGLNGKRGVVLAPRSHVEARGLRAEGRLKIRLDEGGAKPMAVKYANVRAEPSV